MKLKSLLEGYAWERNADGSLPTLKDAINTHQSNLTESANVIKAGVATGRYSITMHRGNIIFIPYADTLDTLDKLSKEQIQDELQSYCESKTNLKFSAVHNYSGTGYAFEIDMYSIVDMIRG